MKSIYMLMAAATLTLGSGCASKGNPLEHRVVLDPGGREVVRIRKGVNAVLVDNESIGDVQVNVVDRSNAVQSIVLDGREQLTLRADDAREIRIDNDGLARVNVRISMKEETVERLGWANAW